MKTAQLLLDNLPNFRGHAALYKCNPPLRQEGWDEEDAVELHHYVVASAVSDGFICETYLFSADEKRQGGGLVGSGWLS